MRPAVVVGTNRHVSPWDLTALPQSRLPRPLSRILIPLADLIQLILSHHHAPSGHHHAIGSGHVNLLRRDDYGFAVRLQEVMVKRDKIVEVTEHAVNRIPGYGVPIAKMLRRQPGADAWPLPDRLAARHVQVGYFVNDGMPVTLGVVAQVFGLPLG